MNELATGTLHHFSDWPQTTLPKGPPGVYTIWNGEQFLYVGISWREPGITASGSTKGLWGRLDSHASGRRSGDQFCVYICDRFVLAEMDPSDIQEVAAGQLSLDALTKTYIRNHLSYRYLVTERGKHARDIEGEIRRGGLNDFGQPYLNPLLFR